MTSQHSKTIQLTAEKVSDGNYRLIIEGEELKDDYEIFIVRDVKSHPKIEIIKSPFKYPKGYSFNNNEKFEIEIKEYAESGSGEKLTFNLPGKVSAEFSDGKVRITETKKRKEEIKKTAHMGGFYAIKIHI